MSLTVEAISSIGRLEKLRDEWNSLLSRSPAKHFALTHEWLSTWWRVFGEGHKLRVVTVRRNGELRCAAPLMESKIKLFGFSLKRIGSFNNFYNPVCDFILSADAEQAIQLIWKHLQDNPRAWDFVEVQPFPMPSQSLRELEKIVNRAGFRFGIRELAPSPFADTSGTWDSYLAGKTSSRRKKWKRLEKKAAEKGGASVLGIRGVEQLDHYLAIAFRIEASGWKGRAGTAVIQDPQAHSFYKSFAHLAARNGWLSLDFLVLDNEPVAFTYEVVFGGTRYAQKIGYLEKWSSIAPGKLLKKRSIERCFRDRVSRYDFLAPGTQLKLEFATGAERRFRLRIYNRNAKGFILFATDCILNPLFKKLMSVAQCRTPADLWRRMITAFRDNIFDNKPCLFFEKDLRTIQPVKARLPGLTFHVATVDEISEAATDPEYLFSRREVQEIPELARQGDVCIVGKVGRKIVYYHWIQFRNRKLSERRILNLGGKKPLIFRCRTLAKYRGKGIYPAALCHAYGYLESRGFRKCYLDVSARNAPSIRGIQKQGARLVGRFHILSVFGMKRAVVPRGLVERVGVAPYWLS